MINYVVKEISTVYVKQYYVTTVDIEVESSNIDVTLSELNMYTVNKSVKGNSTGLFLSVYTYKQINKIQLILTSKDGLNQAIDLEVKSKEKLISQAKKIIKKLVVDKTGTKMFPSGERDDVVYCIDDVEYLPDYNLANISGWILSNEDVIYEGGRETTLLGYTRFMRQDVCDLYNTDIKAGFQLVCKLSTSAEKICFSLRKLSTEIKICIDMAIASAINESDVQRLKSEQYYLKAPYRYNVSTDKRKKIAAENIDVLVACNSVEYFNNILEQTSKIDGANVIVAINNGLNDELSKLYKANAPRITLVCCDKENKEDLLTEAISNTKGRFSLFLNQEDNIEAGIIQDMLDLISHKKRVVVSDYDLIYEGKHIVRVSRNYHSWIKENPQLITVSCLISNDLLDNQDGYDGVIKSIRTLQEKDIAFLYTDNIGYHYNCVADTWNSLVDIKQIAFYLTQYHENEENNKWWGKGFTEWTNVKTGQPKFLGHNQPRIPGELGYYDLVEEKDILFKQVELAQEHGIDGFCFYYYWFNGKRLLRKPLDLFLENVNFDYCICWANENWTRRWDGLEQEVLMEQTYNETTDEQFIYDVIPMFKDKRYIRVENKPLLLIYRMELFPNPTQTINKWREICRKEGIGEIHVSIVQSFEQLFPEQYGADSATEFPPHKVNMSLNTCIDDEVKEKNETFEGNVCSYKTIVENLSSVVMRDYCLMQGSMLEWDNTARRKDKSSIYTDFTPELFRIWCIKNRFYTKLYNYNQGNCWFINAWNEWAEGSYLEPDKKYGRTMLEITKEVSELR